MSYAANYAWIRHGFVRIQGAGRVIQNLPASGRRERVLEHLEAAESELNALDAELAEAAESEPVRRRA